MTFKDFVNKKFIEREHELGRRMTVSEFAEYVGENQGNISHWLNGTRVPNRQVLARLARVWGQEVYEAALPIEAMPANPVLRRALKALQQLPEHQAEEIVRLAEECAAKKADRSCNEQLSFQAVYTSG